MLTFHGSQQLKDKRIAQVRAHRLADQLVHGVYWQDGKGCAVGCTIHGHNHVAYESELGIPVELAYAEDYIFEELPNGKAMLWPENFLKAIPVGVDLRATHINKRYVLALLTDKKRGLLRLIKNQESLKIAQELAEYLKQGIAAPTPTAPPNALRNLADRTYRADLAHRAYLTDRAYLAHRAYLTDRAYRAYLTDRAYLAHRAYRAYLAHRADILLEVLAASAPSTSLTGRKVEVFE